MSRTRLILWAALFGGALFCCSHASGGVGHDLENARRASGPPAPQDDGDDLLAGLNPRPWSDPADTSQQYFPIFVGASPRELVLEGARAAKAKPEIPADLKGIAERQADSLRATLGAPAAEFQIWPTEDWGGQPAWVFARWRAGKGQPWEWLTDAAWKTRRGDAGTPAPQLPDHREVWTSENRLAIFGDFLDLPGLYDEPMFGNCVFVERATRKIALKWPNVTERVERTTELSAPNRYEAYCVNPPARFNDAPIAFVLGVDDGSPAWSTPIAWTPNPPAAAPLVPPHEALKVGAWEPDFDARYKDDLVVFAGEADANFPLSGRTHRFVRKGAWQPGSDLEQLADYLEERYAALGVKTMRQRFMWRGLAQSNVIAILPGTGTGAPVVLADHYDTAVEEDTYAATHQRVTTHGCDDNVTATSLLMRAAETLKNTRHARDIWLVHFTGEEFPSDGLGAWHFLSEMLKEKQDIHAAVITDFIGWHKAGDPAYQLSPTKHEAAPRLAALALDASRAIAPEVRAIYLPRNHPRNSVFQTDIQEFEYVGFPGLLFNEDLDYTGASSDNNPNYHQSTDVCANVMATFAATLSKVAIETVARIADD
jgi:hypothetical protein